MKVWVLYIIRLLADESLLTTIELYETYESARRFLVEYVNKHWEYGMGFGIPRPENDDDAIEKFFGNPYSTYDIELKEVLVERE